MLLERATGSPDVDDALESLMIATREVLGDRLVSLLLYGSVTFDDLAPGYGDLDFVAVVDGDLSETDCDALIAMRKPFRSEKASVVSHMLEGAFLPRAMLDPAMPGRAVWWGTTKNRVWTTNELGWIVLNVIRERGTLVYGHDVRAEIPRPSHATLVGNLKEVLRSTWPHAKANGGLHSIDWLLDAPRQLLWLREGRLSSKSEAADWGYRNAKGEWREHLPKAKKLRQHPELAEHEDTQRWLAGLQPVIDAARAELAAAVDEACEE
ncbi:MAG: DUF4111 domain-containing protein [bacterium]|nr:DUF4111 domain-containing protein [bacterium]